MAKILVVEDDQLIGESIVDGLTANSHTIEWVKNGAEGSERLRLYQYDLAILDWNLPHKDGVDICREYRERGGSTPIIMLTARDQHADKVHGLDAGADDYLTKPFSLAELTARIRAVLRRPTQTLQNVLTLGDLVLDVNTGKATRAGKAVDLLPKEIAVLEYLMRRPNHIYSVNDLLNSVWSSESDSSEDAVRQTIARLRKKLEIEGRQSPIATVKGLGYRVEAI